MGDCGHSSSLETRINYSPSDVFETFPQPPYSDAVASAGGELDAHRSRLMKDRNLGLTSIYNLVHDPDMSSPMRASSTCAICTSHSTSRYAMHTSWAELGSRARVP